MKRNSIGYAMYVKYNPAVKIRSTEELLDKGYNGLVDSIVWKWAKSQIEEKQGRESQIRYTQNGVSVWQ
jgi:hypothetical protein